MNEAANLMVWNILLTGAMSFMGWVLKDKSDELKRVGILLNKTREEIAKEYVTKQEVHADINRILDSLDRLNIKLDMVIKEQVSAKHQ